MMYLIILSSATRSSKLKWIRFIKKNCGAFYKYGDDLCKIQTDFCATNGKMPPTKMLNGIVFEFMLGFERWHPVRDTNPCCRRERAVFWCIQRLLYGSIWLNTVIQYHAVYFCTQTNYRIFVYNLCTMLLPLGCYVFHSFY